MYIDKIKLKNFRSFETCDISFVHNDRDYSATELPNPKLPNINLLLGNNGFGKTSLLKAIALAALGPLVEGSGLYPYRWVRKRPQTSERGIALNPKIAEISAKFISHEQDRSAQRNELESKLQVIRRGDFEFFRWSQSDDETEDWDPIFSAKSDAFFFVGYGATRRVEKTEHIDLGSRQQSGFSRVRKVRSLFEDAYSLIPLNSWLPEIRNSNPSRYEEVVNLVNTLQGKQHFNFSGNMEDGEYLFERSGLSIPFPALSDGYRAYLGWVGDLLYHLCMTCPDEKKLTENRGIVMIDEIDLHLHPKWQMTVLPTLAEALPNIQFIITSHSPLVVGTLEWMNILSMKQAPEQTSIAERINQGIHGLDADQILLTDFFGLHSTRVDSKDQKLKELTLKASEGDQEAAMQLLELMSKGDDSP